MPPATPMVMTTDDTAKMMNTAALLPSPNSRRAMGSQARPGIIWNTDTGTIPMGNNLVEYPRTEPIARPTTVARANATIHRLRLATI